MALACEQLVTAAAEAEKLRASVVRKRARGIPTLSIRRVAESRGKVNDGGQDRRKQWDVIDQFE
jgi:hypothetical protein